MLKSIGILLAGSNWNNGTNTGVSNRNANNVATNTNRNIGSHLELRTTISPEQRFNPYRKVKYPDFRGRDVSTNSGTLPILTGA